jgi:hypothetical protein
MYKSNTGFVPGEWSEGKTIFESEDVTLSQIPDTEMILFSQCDEDGLGTTIAISPAELYKLVINASFDVLASSPFPPEPGAYVTGGRWCSKKGGILE